MNPSYWFATGLLALLGWITRVGFHVLAAGLLVGLGGVVQVWSRVALRGLRLRRSVTRHELVAGSPIGIRIEIENPRPVPVPWLRIDDRVGAVRLSYLLSIGPYQSVTFENRTLAAERGVLSTGPAVLRTTDPFGFRVSRIEADPAGSILVRPRIASLAARKWTLPRPGDALDRSLAKNRRIRILLDVVGERTGATSARAGVETGRRAAAVPTSLIETAISVSGAAASRALELGAAAALDSNGLAAGKRGRLRIRERAGAEQQKRIGSALARLRAGGRIDLTSLLRRALPLAPEAPPTSREVNPVVLVITVGGCARARRYLRRLQKHGHQVLVWTIGDANWFPGSLRIDPGAELDEGVLSSPVSPLNVPSRSVAEPTAPQSDVSPEVTRRKNPLSLGNVDRVLLIAAQAILRLCWVWPWLQFLSLVSLPESGPVLPLEALLTLVAGSWLFGQWMRLGTQSAATAWLRSPDDATGTPARRSPRPSVVRWQAWIRVLSGVAAILLCIWFFEFRSAVPLRDSTWLHILGEDLLTRERMFWRLAGILAGIHVWMGSLFDTEERVDRSAIWRGFMITLSLLIALAALMPVVGLPRSLHPTRALLIAFVALLVGLLRTGPDLGGLLEPAARPVDFVQRKSLFSWGLLSAQLRGKSGR